MIRLTAVCPSPFLPDDAPFLVPGHRRTTLLRGTRCECVTLITPFSCRKTIKFPRRPRAVHEYKYGLVNIILNTALVVVAVCVSDTSDWCSTIKQMAQQSMHTAKCYTTRISYANINKAVHLLYLSNRTVVQGAMYGSCCRRLQFHYFPALVIGCRLCQITRIAK